MPEQANLSSRWFLSCARGGMARVFCFPHAGGNPRSFLDWQRAMDPDAELIAVCAPGRGPRADEPPAETLAELAEGAAAAIDALQDKPVYLFGHSLGALVAFEVARRLSAAPRHLLVSGLAAPALMPTKQAVEIARLDGRAFIEAVASYGGLPPQLVVEEDAYHLLLPGLRSDFRLIESYRYVPASPMTTGLTIINGTRDPHVSRAVLDPWARESRARPTYHWVDGGHFYFETRPEAVIQVLRQLIRADQEDIVYI